MVRIDSTVTEALMHEPSDSSLLWDAVRVMVRLLERACALAGRRRDQPGAITAGWPKKRAHAIQHSRGKERKGQAVSRADRGHACHQGGA